MKFLTQVMYQSHSMEQLLQQLMELYTALVAMIQMISKGTHYGHLAHQKQDASLGVSLNSNTKRNPHLPELYILDGHIQENYGYLEAEDLNQRAT